MSNSRNDNKELEALIFDPSFRKWITSSNSGNDKKWRQWLEDYPHKWWLVEEAKAFLQGIGEEYKLTTDEKEQIRRVLNNHLNRIEAQSKQTSFDGKQQFVNFSKLRYHFQKTWFKAAATLSFLAIFGYLLIVVSNWMRLVEYTTDFGERREFVLPDSSKVILNANSTISYYRGWDEGETRGIWLEGEAFFVVRDTSKIRSGKFVVHTGALDVEVVGTSFNVNNRHQATEVVLNSGKVELSPIEQKTGNKMPMKPGEKVVFSKAGFNKTNVIPENYTAWRNEKMVFDGKSIEDIKRVIKDTYGLQVTFDDTTKEIFNKRIKGTFPANNAEVLLQTLAKTTGTTIEKKGKKVTFKMN